MTEPEQNEHDDDADEERADFPPAPPDADEEHEEARTAEPEPEPQEARAPASEKEIEKALKAVERAGTTYRNAIGRALGEDAQDLLPCPRCNAPVAGLVFPPELAPVDDETRAAVLASIGEGADAAPEMREAEGVEMCDRCNGYGQLVYPTRSPHVSQQTCPRCSGNGYRAVDEPTSNVTSMIITPTATASVGGVVRVNCSLCGQAVVAGEAHWCAPAASQGTGA